MLNLPRRPLLMGILNVTPDSFSDGGKYLNSEAALEHAQTLVNQGADLLDIGGESTRPSAQPVSLQEELDRVIPVIEALCKQMPVPVSIDTSKSAVATAAIAAGAEIINDVTALGGDPHMVSVAQQSAVGVCLMHMQGTPETMQDDPQYTDVVAEVAGFLDQKRDELVAAGIAMNRICIDPGIGFGKTREQNLALLANCRRLIDLGCPVLVGHSRKNFLETNIRGQPVDRLAATIGISCALARQGVQILRVHDVATVRHALTSFMAVEAYDSP